jgi:hypothetical protein
MMASCIGCGKPNEYQPEDYTCWECTNVWPSETATSSAPAAGPTPTTGQIAWSVGNGPAYFMAYFNSVYDSLAAKGVHGRLRAIAADQKYHCDNCGKSAGRHSSDGRCCGKKTSFSSAHAREWFARQLGNDHT